MANDNPKDWREARRLRAFELSQAGWTGVAIAQALGASEGAVSQWLRRAREGGKEALRTRKGSGRPAELPVDDLERLPELLAQGPEHFGFRGQVWTRGRVREVIRRAFGVRFSEGHVGRLLRRLGWSPQKPIFRPTQRDEEAIERWVAEDWPRIKKKPSASGA
jgi:transposase